MALSKFYNCFKSRLTPFPEEDLCRGMKTSVEMMSPGADMKEFEELPRYENLLAAAPIVDFADIVQEPALRPGLCQEEAAPSAQSKKIYVPGNAAPQSGNLQE